MASISASVPELSATASAAPQYSANRSSSAASSSSVPTNDPRSRSFEDAVKVLELVPPLGRKVYVGNVMLRHLTPHRILRPSGRCSELLLGQMLVRREGDHRIGLPIRHGKIALLVAIGAQAFLQIQRHRIVHLRLDPLLLAMSKKLVAALGEHDVEVEDEFRSVKRRGSLIPGIRPRPRSR